MEHVFVLLEKLGDMFKIFFVLGDTIIGGVEKLKKQVSINSHSPHHFEFMGELKN